MEGAIGCSYQYVNVRHISISGYSGVSLPLTCSALPYLTHTQDGNVRTVLFLHINTRKILMFLSTKGILLISMLIACMRFTKLCWVEKHINVIMKPTNSPTQRQPNPRNIWLKVAFGPRFPTTNNFSWVGVGLCRKQTTKNPTQSNSPRTP